MSDAPNPTVSGFYLPEQTDAETEAREQAETGPTVADAIAQRRARRTGVYDPDERDDAGEPTVRALIARRKARRS